MIREFEESVRNLSGRELEVLRNIASGDTYMAIAHRMNISPHTVDTYVRRIRAKTGARNRMHLLQLALHVQSPGVISPWTPAPSAIRDVEEFEGQ